MHTCRTDSDASHHSFSFTARARLPDPDAQRGSTQSPRGSQGGIPLSPRLSQPSSAREVHSSAKPRPDSSFAVKVLGSTNRVLLTYLHQFVRQKILFVVPTCAKDMHTRAVSYTQQPICYSKTSHPELLRINYS